MRASKQQLSKFAAIFAGGTLASRALGLLRDIVILPLVPKAPRDAFLFAFKLPNMLRDMLGEGAVNAAFVPTFSATLESESRDAFRQLVAACFGAMILVFAMITVLGVSMMPLLPELLELVQHVTGMEAHDPAEVAEWVRMLQWTFPYLFFIGLAVFAMGPLFALQRYAAPAWSPALLNIAIILCAMTLHDRFENPAWALVVGVWAGGIAQLCWMLAAMRHHAGVLLPSFRIFHPGVKRVCWLLVPVIFGQAAGEVNKLVDVLFAIDIGAVSVLFVANRLVQLPLALFGLAVAVAILPALSRAAKRGDEPEMRGILAQGLRQSGFLLFPATAGLIVLGEPVIRLLFERGEFSAVDTLQSAQALRLYALGLVAFAWARISAQAFYARHDTRTPVIAATCSMLLNIVLNVLLVGRFGFHGLAIATAIAFSLNALLLLVLLRRRMGSFLSVPDWASLLRMVLASAVAAGGAFGARAASEAQFIGDTPLSRVMDVFPPLITAVLLYAVACRILRIEELSHFWQVLRRRSGG